MFTLSGTNVEKALLWIIKIAELVFFFVKIPPFAMTSKEQYVSMAQSLLFSSLF